MLDGQQLPTSALPGSGSIISAVIDTVITALCTADRILILTPIEGKRSNPGAEGIVENVWKQVSSAFASTPT